MTHVADLLDISALMSKKNTKLCFFEKIPENCHIWAFLAKITLFLPFFGSKIPDFYPMLDHFFTDLYGGKTPEFLAFVVVKHAILASIAPF